MNVCLELALEEENSAEHGGKELQSCTRNKVVAELRKREKMGGLPVLHNTTGEDFVEGTACALSETWVEAAT